MFSFSLQVRHGITNIQCVMTFIGKIISQLFYMYCIQVQNISELTEIFYFEGITLFFLYNSKS